MRRRRSFKRLNYYIIAIILLLLALSNYQAHQPRERFRKQLASLPPTLSRQIEQLGDTSADFTDALGLTGHDVSVLSSYKPNTNSVFFAGMPQRLSRSTLPNDLKILHKTGFTIAYSPLLKHAVWAAYKTFLTPNRTLPPRPSGFKPDSQAPNSPKQQDYTHSGYDRGHLAPNLAIARCYGRSAQLETFLTSNICPQRPGLNQGPWRHLEYRISELWPHRFETVWVIVGCIPSADNKRLPSGVHIPQALYQVVVAQTQEDKILAFAVYMPQHTRRHTFARATLVSIDEIEKLTGIDFLNGLPEEVSAHLESVSPTRLWPVGLTGAFRLLWQRYRKY